MEPPQLVSVDHFQPALLMVCITHRHVSFTFEMNFFNTFSTLLFSVSTVSLNAEVKKRKHSLVFILFYFIFFQCFTSVILQTLPHSPFAARLCFHSFHVRADAGESRKYEHIPFLRNQNQMLSDDEASVFGWGTFIILFLHWQTDLLVLITLRHY